MKKRILALLMAAMLVISALPIFASADFTPMTGADWSDNVSVVDDVIGDGDSYQYLHIYNLNYCEDYLIYEDKTQSWRREINTCFRSGTAVLLR